MCGRYCLALRPSQIRRRLEADDMPVADAPPDEGEGAPRQSYNFAPGCHGVVYRADTSHWGSGQQDHGLNTEKSNDAHVEVTTGATAEIKHDQQLFTIRYRMQSMKWGLIPFWTKRNPDYGSMMKTINCRDDSLSKSGGMWSTMKARKRCVVVAEGFYEWLKSGKEKTPHFVKRKDGRLMCFAGLWDCVKYEDSHEQNYTYTIITTDSNKQLRFLHDRMPVILDPGSIDLKTWLDPGRHEWSRELQKILKPFEGELECYPVNKDVGKVGNNSPSFIIPIASKENKSNIANFFSNTSNQKDSSQSDKRQPENGKVPRISGQSQNPEKQSGAEDSISDGTTHKRKRESLTPDSGEEESRKIGNESDQRPSRRKISATSNGGRGPIRGKGKATPKITSFFANSA